MCIISMRVSVGACLVLFLGFGNVITKYILNVSEPCCFEILIILHLRFCFFKVPIHSWLKDITTINSGIKNRLVFRIYSNDSSFEPNTKRKQRTMKLDCSFSIQ